MSVTPSQVKWMHDEIDRLRAAMELAERCHLEQAMQWKAEIDRLRAEIVQFKHALEMQQHTEMGLRAENAELRKASHQPASDQEPQKSA